MKLPILATLASSTAAFIPYLNNNVSPLTPVQRKMSLFENELGVQPPLGFWDPLGLLKDADQARFNRLRYVEPPIYRKSAFKAYCIRHHKDQFT